MELRGKSDFGEKSDILKERYSFIEKDQMAESIQRAWKKLQERKTRMTDFVSILPAVQKLCDLHQLFRVNSDFTFLQAALQHSDVINSAATFISKVSKDKHILQLPRQFRSPRALLSALFIKHCPGVLMGENSETKDITTKQVLNAASMLVGSFQSLHTKMQSFIQRETGCFHKLFFALAYTTFSYNYYTSSFYEWKTADKEELVSNLAQSYASTYAALKIGSLQNENAQILNQIKKTLLQVIGQEKLDKLINKIESAIDENSKHGTSQNAASESLPQATQSAGNSVAFPSYAEQFLSNEQMAHELILDPENILKGVRQKQFGGNEENDPPETALAKRVHDTVHRAFWDSILVSLAPPNIEMNSLDGIRDGDTVDYKKAEDITAYSPARVLNKNANGTLKLLLDNDCGDETIVESVNLSEIRVLTKSPDYTPLLGVLEEVREKLASLTPSRSDLINEIQEKMDSGLMKQMLEKNVFDITSIRGLITFISGKILELQSPARVEETKHWLAQFNQKVDSLGDKGFIPLIPEIFEFFFGKIEEIKQDILLFKLERSIPYFQQNGIDYERSKVTEAVRAGKLALTKTEAWLSKQVVVWIEEGQTKRQKNRTDLQRELISWSDAVSLNFLASAFLDLLQSKSRLDNHNQQSPLPETLRYDGKRLALARDGWDRVTLVVTMGSLLRQFCLSENLHLPTETAMKVEKDLNVLLQQEGTFLPHLIESTVAVVQELWQSSFVDEKNNEGEEKENQGQTKLPEKMEEKLRNLMKNCAHPDHVVFSLFFKRIGAVVFEMMARQGSMNAVLEQTGLAPYYQEIRLFALPILKLVGHNRAVHSALYLEIVKRYMSGFDENEEERDTKTQGSTPP